ncbi:hypothetical protein V6N13_066956 [Hibiscus sabdariffa]
MQGNNDGCLEGIESNRHLGECELKGNPNNYNQLSGEGNRVLEEAERLQVPLIEKVERGIEGNVSHDDIMVGLEFDGEPRALEDVRCMGLESPNELNDLSGSIGPRCVKSAWETSVGSILNFPKGR